MGLPPPLYLPGRVVVLELSCADPGERAFHEDLRRFRHHLPPRLARSRRVLAGIRDAAHASPEGGGQQREHRDHHDHGRGGESRLQAAAVIQQHEDHCCEAEEAAARLGEDDRREHRAHRGCPQQANAEGRRRPRSLAAAPGSLDARRRGTAPHGEQGEQGGEWQEDDHVQRQVVRVAEDAAHRARHAAAFDEVDPAQVVDHGARRDVRGREHDEPRELLEPGGRVERVHHQHDDQQHLEVHAGDHLDRPARPERERGGADQDEAKRHQAPQFRRRVNERQPAHEALHGHGGQSDDGRQFRQVQRLEERKLVLRPEEEHRGEGEQAEVGPVAALAGKRVRDDRVDLILGRRFVGPAHFGSVHVPSRDAIPEGQSFHDYRQTRRPRTASTKPAMAA